MDKNNNKHKHKPKIMTHVTCDMNTVGLWDEMVYSATYTMSFLT